MTAHFLGPAEVLLSCLCIKPAMIPVWLNHCAESRVSLLW